MVYYLFFLTVKVIFKAVIHDLVSACLVFGFNASYFIVYQFSKCDC